MEYLKETAIALTILSVVGGVLFRAYVAPVKTKTEDNHMEIQDHEDRLRKLEHKQTETNIKMETVIKHIDTLVTKIDMLVSLQLNQKNSKENK